PDLLAAFLTPRWRMSKTNAHVADRVDDLLHGLLSSDDAAHAVQHCLQCPDCQAALDAAHKRLAALQGVPATEASPQLVQKTLKKIDEHARSRGRLRAWLAGTVAAAIAASALTLLCLHLYYRNLSASPYDLQVLGQTRLQSGTMASLNVRLNERPQGKALA